jgi:hypothetical protein
MGRATYVIPSNQLDLFDVTAPSMPVFDKSRCETRLINYETAARMVETYHYAHRVPSIVSCMGMYVDNILGGVITYGIPPNRNMLACCGKEYIPHALELNRLFIYDWCGRNSESWFIAKSFYLLPTRYFILISYADTEHDHLGYIYQATNWLYTGVSQQSGGPQDIIVDGKKYHSKGFGNKYSGGQKAARELGLRVIAKKRSIKHRYVYLLGSKSQKKKLRKALKWPVLPYPKEIVDET